MRTNFYCARSPYFKRALKSNEEKDFIQITNEAKSALGIDNGIHMFKVFQSSLPACNNQNLGIGKINSKEALNYLDFMALYTGSNAIKIYPSGQYPTKPRFPNYYCPYERFASVVGEDNINFFRLTSEKYGHLLATEDVQKYTTNSPVVDYENELEHNCGADFELIKKAYGNMQSKDDVCTLKIREEFSKFKNSLQNDTMDRLAIAPFVKAHDPDLFAGFENNSDKQKRFEEYKEKYSSEIDIYKFGKFLALKNIAEAKENLNKKGLELYGDCPIGFSEDEIFAFPDAFYPKNITPGWGFRAIKYQDIPKDGTMANRLFKEKISWHLEAFDGIRFDVGWQYFSPKLTKIDEDGNSTTFRPDVGDGIVEFIEKTAKTIKGGTYDTKKLMYECDAGGEDFQMFDWKDDKATCRDIMKGRTPVLTSVYENASGFGWGQPLFFEKAGMKQYMYGTNNHDSTPLRVLAEEDFDDKGNEIIELAEIRKNNITALNKTMGLAKKWLSIPKNFIKAKFAQLFLAKNHFVFFNDVIGSNKRMDKENSDPQNYRYKIPNNYEEQYHTALQEGYGFNLAESLKLAMKAKKLDKKYPELYAKLQKYSDILYSEGPKTKKEAENFSV